MSTEDRKTIRLVIADDQHLFLEGLRTVIEVKARDLEVVATAENGVDAIARVAEFRPDIVLMDVRMPQLDGVEATQVIRTRFPATQVIMLTTFDDDDYVYSALQHGAAGYLLKDTGPTKLFSAIRSVSQGAFLVSPSVVARLAQNRKQDEHHGSQETTETENQKHRIQAFDQLSRRERTIFDLMASGYDNHEISEQLAIAPQTVKNYVSAIYFKLDLPDRLHLIRFARKIGQTD